MIYLNLAKNASSAKVQKVIFDKIYPYFQEKKRTLFNSDQVYFLVNDNGIRFTFLSKVAKRPLSEVDLLIRIDLNKKLNIKTIKELKKIRTALEVYDTNLSMSLMNNYLFHNDEQTRDSDVAMGFINTWRPEKSQFESQNYWLQRHGPLVLEVGLPHVIKSYAQIHTDLKNPFNGEVFDTQFQGMSFETISGKWPLIFYYLKNSSSDDLNAELLRDEENFTGPPLFTIYRRIEGRHRYHYPNNNTDVRR